MPVKIKIKNTKKEKEKMSTIEVGKVLTTTQEISNAVKVFHEYYNAGEKEIKYITFSYVPYNSVNDMVACTASGKIEVSGKLTGPIPPKHKSYVTWETMWFNPTVTTAVLTKIHVQFMDNTEEMIDGKDIVFTDDEKSAYYRDITIPANYHKKIDDASGKLSKNYRKAGANDALSEVLSEFKNDEDGLLEVFKDVKKAGEVFKGTKTGCAMGYILGDYIERNYSSNRELMNTAVSFWKSSIDYQQKYYNTPDAKEHTGYPEKYAAKIKKYEPAYVIPKKAGCVSFG